MPYHWSIVSPQFAAALIFLSFAAWALWRRVRRSRRKQTASAVAGVAIVLSVAAILTLVNSYFSYLPHLQDVTNVLGEERDWPAYSAVDTTGATQHPDGLVVHLPVPDRGSGFGATTALVYLPPQYFSDLTARFPVVYLFHGSPGVPGDWMRGGEAADTAGRLARGGHPAIVVSPRMSHGWLDDPECVDGVSEKVESHLLRDVLPAVDGTLRTVANRDGRSFGGMSAGGYCALNMGLRHRDLAATVLDFSGFTRPTHTGGMRALFGPITPQVQRRVDANTPAEYAATLSAGPPTKVWLDTGSSDSEVLGEMTPLAATLRERGIDVEYRVRTGAHTFSVWVPAFQESLPWALGMAPGSSPDNPSAPRPGDAVALSVPVGSAVVSGRAGGLSVVVRGRRRLRLVWSMAPHC